MSETKTKGLVGDIAQVLNRHSAENDSNTPDFILANYLLDCLAAFGNAVRPRDRWYGVEHKPGEVAARPIIKRSDVLSPLTMYPDDRNGEAVECWAVLRSAVTVEGEA